MLTLGVLGPLWAADEHGPVSLKGPRHRAVLARLLVARGRVVPVSLLIDDLWEQPPANATGAIQTFVSALRRALEPDRGARQPARILVTAAPGYALRLDPDRIDAGRFEHLARTGGEQLAAGQHEAALGTLDTALELWQGPAYAEFADQSWARGEITRLDESRLRAVEQRAEALLHLGRDTEVAAALEPHLTDHPLREQAWQTLALALYRSGRQVDALAALRSIGHHLRDELGMDPSPRLRDLESAMLAQAPELLPGRETTRGWSGNGIEYAGAGRGDAGATDIGSEPVSARSGGGSAIFVGRAEVLARLRHVADGVATRGRARLVLVSGVEGVGKTALVEAMSNSLAREGWLIAWGPSPADKGTPPNWPWTRIAATLDASGRVPPEPPRDGDKFTGAHGAPAGAVDADPTVARFLSLRMAVDHVSQAAAAGPVAVVFDDLQWAGEETLDLLTMLVSAPVVGPVLLVGIYRNTEVGTGLTAALGRLARWEPERVPLAGLGAPETDELVRTVAGADVSTAAIAGIHQRGNGNPFFTRELSRLLRDEGESALETVPAGVRDVVRHRLATLPAAARTVLEQASIIGDHVNLDLLMELAESVARNQPTAAEQYSSSPRRPNGVGSAAQQQVVRPVGEAAVWTAQQDAQAMGSVTSDVRDRAVESANGVASQPVPEGAGEADQRVGTVLVGSDGAGSGGVDWEQFVLAGVDVGVGAGFLDGWGAVGVGFVHGVVREVVYGEISGGRRAEWHAAVGELLERGGGADAVLAHHFGRAGTRGTAGRAAEYARRAAVAAEAAFAPGEAVRWWEQAVSAYGRIGLGPVGRNRRDGGGGAGAERVWFDAAMGLVRALAVTGRLARAREWRMETLGAAHELGDPELIARVIVAFDVPAVWTDSDDPVAAARIATAAQDVLERLPEGERELRCRLLATIALELRNADTSRGRAAAEGAEAIARESDSPALLALALNARFMQSFHHAGLAPERARIGIELLTLSRAHGLVTFEVLGHLIRVQALSATADFDAADEHATAVDSLADTYGLPLVSFFTRWYSALRHSISAPYPEAEAAYRAAAAAAPGTAMPGLERGLLPMALLCLRLRHELPIDIDPGTEWGSHEPWVRPLLLLARDRPDEARNALRATPFPPPDLLLELRLCLLAEAAVALDEQALIHDLYARLLPAAAELAGAGTGLLTLRPVSHYLRRLERASTAPPAR